jgi:hypothetical protein
MSPLEVFDSVFEEAAPYVDSESQLSRCLAGLMGRATRAEKGEQKRDGVGTPPPIPKSFDSSKYQDIISSLKKHMSGPEFEKACTPIVIDILENYEGFTNIFDSNQGEGFNNPPFDFLGFKKGIPHLIEFKGSLENFNSPGETQKRRLQELLQEIEGLEAALLQVKLRESQYRILYTEDLKRLLFNGHQAPMEPIINWIKMNIGKVLN